jgi:hypothetical protein
MTAGTLSPPLADQAAAKGAAEREERGKLGTERGGGGGGSTLSGRER